MNSTLVLFFKLILFNAVLSSPMALIQPNIAIGTFFILCLLNFKTFISLHNKILKMVPQKPLAKTSPYPIWKTLDALLKSKSVNNIKISTYDQTFGQCFFYELPFQKYHLLINKNLFSRLNSIELKTLATLLAHEKALDIPKKLTVAYLAISPLILFAQYIDACLRFLTGAKVRFQLKKSHPFTYILSPIIPLVVNLFASPKLQLLADMKTAKTLNNRHSLPRLLQKIEDYQSHEPPSVPVDLFHLFVCEPLTQLNLYRYLKWHPDLEKRTINLTGHYPA